MRKKTVCLLSLLLVLCFAAASAQTVYCPSGGFSLNLPDRFGEIAPQQPNDPDLVLHYSDGAVDLTTYVSFSGSSDSFQVLTGDETEYGPVTINGMEMFRVRGLDANGPWISYSWIWAGRSVCVSFVWSGDEETALSVIRDIMNSIVFG